MKDIKILVSNILTTFLTIIVREDWLCPHFSQMSLSMKHFLPAIINFNTIKIYFVFWFFTLILGDLEGAGIIDSPNSSYIQNAPLLGLTADMLFLIFFGCLWFYLQKLHLKGFLIPFHLGSNWQDLARRKTC